MSKEKGHFKGRVVDISGSKITIDIKAETREIIDKATGERKLVGSSWKSPDMPKIGQVVRGIFKSE